MKMLLIVGGVLAIFLLAIGCTPYYTTSVYLPESWNKGESTSTETDSSKTSNKPDTTSKTDTSKEEEKLEYNPIPSDLPEFPKLRDYIGQKEYPFLVSEDGNYLLVNIFGRSSPTEEFNGNIYQLEQSGDMRDPPPLGTWISLDEEGEKLVITETMILRYSPYFRDHEFIMEIKDDYFAVSSTRIIS
jgi:hypothetical protein